MSDPACSPNRAEVQATLYAFRRRSTSWGVLIFMMDAALYAVAACGVIFAHSFWLRFVCSLALGLLTGLLFVVGHDACHQSLTPHRSLNKLIGRLAFLPSLHAFSLWDLGHNRIHHRYTNLKGVDYVFAPLTKAEYEALARPRRWRERLYRSVWGQWLFYFYEIWWKKMFFPRLSAIDRKRIVYTLDSMLVAAWAVLHVCAALLLPTSLNGGHLALSPHWWQTPLLLVLLPQLIWNWLMGFIIHQHHTHTKVAWFDNREEWMRDEQLRSSVHIRFPGWVGLLLHNIMEHTAHHAQMQIPLYEVRRAQAALERKFPAAVIEQSWSLKQYLDTTKRCKLYDYERHNWTDFEGRPTSLALRDIEARR